MEWDLAIFKSGQFLMQTHHTPFHLSNLDSHLHHHRFLMCQHSFHYRNGMVANVYSCQVNE